MTYRHKVPGRPNRFRPSCEPVPWRRYAFVDEWLVPGPVEEVYELLSCPRDYPRWWGDASRSSARAP